MLRGREGGDAAHGHVAGRKVSLNRIMVKVETNAGSPVVRSDETGREPPVSSLLVENSAEL